jgi:hypothetical protein
VWHDTIGGGPLGTIAGVGRLREIRRTRTFRADRLAFEVACPSDEIVDALDAMFSGLDADDDADGDQAGTHVVTIELHPEGDEWAIEAPGYSHPPRALDVTMSNIVGVVQRLALDVDPSRLHVHAAALERDGRGLIVCASSGTGKSTLAAALATDGWRYLTDEAVALDPASTDVDGFTRPIVVDRHSVDIVPGLAELAISPTPGSDIRIVPVAGAAPELTSATEPVALVCLVRPEAGESAPTLTAIHPADAVVILMGQTLDAQRFGPDALAELARLAARCTCVRATIGDVVLMRAAMADLAARPADITPMRAIVPVPNTSAWVVLPDVRSVMLGERVVIHDTHGGAVVSLDEAGTAAWLGAVGQPPDWWPPEMLHELSTVEFLSQLAQLGLIAPSHA